MMPKRGWFKALGDGFAGMLNPAVRVQNEQISAVEALIEAFEDRAQAAARDPAASVAWIEQNIDLGPQLSAQAVQDFTASYVRQAPAMLWAVLEAADKTNARIPIMEVTLAFGRYLDEEDDLIPDGLGIIGLADDAYFAQRMTANLVQADPHPLKAANAAMVSLLPMAIADALDEKVSRALTVVARTLRQFASQHAVFEQCFQAAFEKCRHRVDPAMIEQVRHRR
jgi:hypothetical protein